MWVNLKEARLWVESSGRRDASVVLLSHSLGSSGIMWEPQLPALEASYTVLRMDTRGHGQSSAPPGPYTFQALARDVIGLLDALDIRQVHFVGLSMGGMIGQALAIHHPRRLLSLTLCDTAASNPPGAAEIWRQRIAQIHREGLAGLLEPTLARWFSPEFLQSAPPIVEKIRLQFLATPVAGYLGCCEAIMALDFAAQLPVIRVPTLIMVGEHDPGTPVSAAREIQAGIAGSLLEILAGARHLSNVERPQDFNRIVLDFLSHH
jgi:3-oxoadipate enol-lactonase